MVIRIPNQETIEALEEVELMKKDRSIGKTYTDVDEMMRDLLNDDLDCSDDEPKQ